MIQTIGALGAHRSIRRFHAQSVRAAISHAKHWCHARHAIRFWMLSSDTSATITSLP